MHQQQGTASDANVALCTRFFDAVERGDQTTMAELMVPNATIWHCSDDQTLPFAHFLPGLTALARWSFRYGARHYSPLPDGALAQHRLQGTLPDGSRVDVPVAVRLVVENGRIARLEEYLDTAAVAKLAAAIMGQ